MDMQKCNLWINEKTQCGQFPATESPTGVILCQEHGKEFYGRKWNVNKDMRLLNYE